VNQCMAAVWQGGSHAAAFHPVPLGWGVPSRVMAAGSPSSAPLPIPTVYESAVPRRWAAYAGRPCVPVHARETVPQHHD
jgi:hypothetical protein